MDTPGTTACHVFTPEWVAEQVRKYGKPAEHERPRLYHLWVCDEAQELRDNIERWVDSLSPEARQRVIPRLRAPEQYLQTWNELAVGDSFRRMGHQAEYEKDVQGLTPDWFVATAVHGRFIAEVVSSMPPIERQRCDAGWDALGRRVETLRGNVDLAITPPLDHDRFTYFDPPTARRQKEIVREVGLWLAASPPDGALMTIDEIEITLIRRSAGLEHVACGIGTSPFTVDGEPLKVAVKEKASRYKDVAVALQTAVCGLRRTGLLLGTRASRLGGRRPRCGVLPPVDRPRRHSPAAVLPREQRTVREVPDPKCGHACGVESRQHAARCHRKSTRRVPTQRNRLRAEARRPRGHGWPRSSMTYSKTARTQRSGPACSSQPTHRLLDLLMVPLHPLHGSLPLPG